MKKAILLVLLIPSVAFSQIIEDFESGSTDFWVQNPEGHWNADNTASISGNYSLHHTFDNADAGTSRIGLSVSNLKPSQGLTSWSFKIRHGYDPSLSNNWCVMLISDTDPASLTDGGEWSGYAMGVNQTGYDDTLRLWKVKNGVFNTVINTGINWQTDIGITDPVKISIERTVVGEWSVSVYHVNDELIRQGKGIESELFNQEWFVIAYKYSSARDRLLWIDDIYVEGVFKEDEEAPEIMGFEIINSNTIKIIFSEEPRGDLMEPSNFFLVNTAMQPAVIFRENNITCRIIFYNTFINKALNNMIINLLCDGSGNCEENISVEFTPVWVETGDVIISEVMADPVPAVSLPEKEYLEIFNRTEYSFNMTNWKLTSVNQVCSFPESTIKPFEYMIICADNDTSLFKNYGKTTGLKSFPPLTDGGKTICLCDASGNLIHGVEYSKKWYGNELKDDGGWSLEMIDSGFPFFQDGNWSASVSRSGGTPGIANSVSRNNPDKIFNGIQNVFPEDSVLINIRFSEPVRNLQDNAAGITIGMDSVKSVLPVDPLLREFNIIPAESLERGEIYTLYVSEDIRDMAGNSMYVSTFDFGIAESSIEGDIVFNELMFNPFPGDPDYIEFYNCSERVTDASRFIIVSVNDATGDRSSAIRLSREKRCIIPGTYYVMTTDKERIISRYFSSDPDKIFETGDLPSMSDSEGHLELLNLELDKVDEVLYDEKMHYPLLSGYEGISLEKVRPGCASNEKSNWHSASEASGWGTPGTANSVFTEQPVMTDNIILSSTRITPDNDGNEDILVIDFVFTGNGNIVTVTIFDETGTYVNRLAENLFAGYQASLVWDGTADDGKLVSTGIYIILISVFDDNGKSKQWKKVCTVIRE